MLRRSFVVVFILCFVLIGCKTNTNNNYLYDINEVDEVSISLNSADGIKNKLLKQKSDYERVLLYIEEIEKTPTKDKNNNNGWEILITIKDDNKREHIRLLGNNLIIAGECFVIDEESLDEFIELFDEFDYEVKTYIQ